MLLQRELMFLELRGSNKNNEIEIALIEFFVSARIIRKN